MVRIDNAQRNFFAKSLRNRIERSMMYLFCCRHLSGVRLPCSPIENSVFYSNKNEKARGKSFHKTAGCQPEKLNTQMTLYVILVEAASSVI